MVFNDMFSRMWISTVDLL